MKKTDPPILQKSECKGTPQRIWKALTDPAEMRLWFFKNIAEFEPRTGFSTEFLVDTGEREFLHFWEVTEVIPEKMIATVWEYGDLPGKMLVSFEINHNDPSEVSEVTLTCEILDDFSEEHSEFTRESCEGGWEYFLQQSLPAYLSDGKELAF